MAKVNLRSADYLQAADIETKMWRHYYNHNFIGLGWQLLKFMRTIFRCGWMLSLRLAWNSAVAAAVYRRQKGHEDYARVLKSLVKFYKIGSDHSINPFDYRKAAELELEWWDIHRYPEKYEKTLQQSIAESAAVIYHCRPADVKKYAGFRAQAAQMLTHEGDKHIVKNDWPKIEKLLDDTWRSFHQSMQDIG